MIGGSDGVAIGQCIDELLLAKRNGNKTERYIESLGHYLRQFANGREQKPISDFTFLDVEQWMARYDCADTRRTWLSRLSPLFSFAVRRGYMDKNPCDRVERVTVDRKPPVILTPCQSRELLAATSTVMRPYVILGMYGGLRPEEIPKLDWSQINLDAATVVATGKRRRRLVTLEPIAVKLLREHPLKSGPVCPSNSTVDRWRAKAKAVLGLAEWPQDLLRHTAASYLLTLIQDAGKVATRIGNSVKVLNAHYLNPPSATDCAAFWQLESNDGGASGRAFAGEGKHMPVINAAACAAHNLGSDGFFIGEAVRAHHVV